MKRIIFLLIGLLPALFIVQAQYIMEPEDMDIYSGYIKTLQDKSELPFNDLIIESAKYFLGTPYVAGTLENESGDEELVINLREMDCTTFVEYVLALSRTLKLTDSDVDDFANNLRQIRYRDGRIDGYANRLHYFTDWLYENDKNGIIKDLSQESGGIPFPVQLSFMSSHPDSYATLKRNPQLLREIAAIEKDINKHSYFYLPEDKLTSYMPFLQNGDIVAFTTRIEGLDVTHLGFIYQEGGKTTFIHASTNGMKVIVNEESIADYVKRYKNTSGILIARPLPVH